METVELKIKRGEDYVLQEVSDTTVMLECYSKMVFVKAIQDLVREGYTVIPETVGGFGMVQSVRMNKPVKAISKKPETQKQETVKQETPKPKPKPKGIEMYRPEKEQVEQEKRPTRTPEEKTALVEGSTKPPVKK